MEIEEQCSCGASFRASGDNVTRLLKQWRSDHVCVTKNVEPDAAVITSSDTKTEISLGFAPTEMPGREDYGVE